MNKLITILIITLLVSIHSKASDEGYIALSVAIESVSNGYIPTRVFEQVYNELNDQAEDNNEYELDASEVCDYMWAGEFKDDNKCWIK